MFFLCQIECFQPREDDLRLQKGCFSCLNILLGRERREGKVYLFWIRSGWLFANVLICVQCSVGSSFLIAVQVGFRVIVTRVGVGNS